MTKINQQFRCPLQIPRRRGTQPHGMSTQHHIPFDLPQDRLGVEVTSLISEASTATITSLAGEAHAQLAHEEPGSRGVATAAKDRNAGAELWVARAPVTIKLRLFCLPYAGGVSENVFGR